MSVYFIEDTVTGFVKIGYSGNVKARLSTLQTATAHKLKLLHSMEGSLKDEGRIHRELRQYRVHGEWFEGEAAQEYISSMQSKRSEPKARITWVYGLEPPEDGEDLNKPVLDMRKDACEDGILWAIRGETLVCDGHSHVEKGTLFVITDTDDEFPSPNSCLSMFVELVQMDDKTCWWSCHSIIRIDWTPTLDSDGELWAFEERYREYEDDMFWFWFGDEQEDHYFRCLDDLEASTELNAIHQENKYVFSLSGAIAKKNYQEAALEALGVSR